MNGKGKNTQADHDERRARGKALADRLRDAYAERGEPMGWFDACYREAGGDPALIPWAHMTPRPELAEWLDGLPEDRRTGRALDVGAGLGDNAALLAGAGFAVTAFDISGTAMAWARERFASLPVEWRAADLCDSPAEWDGAFDLVNETYTLQALRPPQRRDAIRALGRFLRPGGTLLIVARGRRPDEPENPPPWPLLKAELDGLAALGLEEVSFEDFLPGRKERAVRHFRAEYRRA